MLSSVDKWIVGLDLCAARKFGDSDTMRGSVESGCSRDVALKWHMDGAALLLSGVASGGMPLPRCSNIGGDRLSCSCRDLLTWPLYPDLILDSRLGCIK